jgi:hypothetical protein
MRTELWLESLKGRGHSEDLGVDGRLYKIYLREIAFGVWFGIFCSG